MNRTPKPRQLPAAVKLLADGFDPLDHVKISDRELVAYLDLAPELAPVMANARRDIALVKLANRS